MLSYWSFIKQNLRFLSFGLVLVFVGNYGQTFFISVFGGVWREAFDLSHTQYSFYYSLATLISGFALMIIGGKLDTSSLKTFTLWVLTGTLIATLVLAFALNAYWLFAGFLLIRFCGQGLTGHTAFTTMARYFDKNRGKAISVASMGMPIGEFILPVAAAFTIAAFGWRETWIGLAVLLVLCFVPLLLWSLGDPRASQPVTQVDDNTEQDNNAQENNTETNNSDQNRPKRHWQRRDVIRDPRFWFTVPAILSPAVLITGIFFHQAFWAEARGWSLSWVASSMTLYAITHALGSLFTGALVDKLGAKRVMRLYLLPLAIATLMLQVDAFWGWAFFMLVGGLSVGASGPTIGALWPEVYGTKHLGSIRAMVSALMVLSTAVAPIVLGTLIDQQLSVSSIMAGLAGYAIVSLLICQKVYQKALQTKVQTIDP